MIYFVVDIHVDLMVDIDDVLDVDLVVMYYMLYIHVML